MRLPSLTELSDGHIAELPKSSAIAGKVAGTYRVPSAFPSNCVESKADYFGYDTGNVPAAWGGFCGYLAANNWLYSPNDDGFDQAPD